MGYITDAEFLARGFTADIDAYGNEKVRDASISQENQQRAKCLTSVIEVEKRAQRLAEIDLERKRKEQVKESKIQQSIIADWAVVEKVAHLKHPRGKRPMDDAINGVDNCISVAFRVRNKKSRLLAMKELNNSRETEATNAIDDNISAGPLEVTVSL